MNEQSDFENKKTITFTEFKAWLAGLIRGMNGELPGVEEWKLIKQMMDKVVEEPHPQPNESPKPPHPTAPTPVPWPQPHRPYEWPWDKWPHDRIWCTGSSLDRGSTNLQLYNSEGPASSLTHDFGEQPITFAEDIDSNNCSFDEAIDNMIAAADKNNNEKES